MRTLTDEQVAEIAKNYANGDLQMDMYYTEDVGVMGARYDTVKKGFDVLLRILGRNKMKLEDWLKKGDITVSILKDSQEYAYIQTENDLAAIAAAI